MNSASMPETTFTYNYDSMELLIASRNVGIDDNDEDFQQILNCLATVFAILNMLSREITFKKGLDDKV